jgi:hypothetical protein
MNLFKEKHNVIQNVEGRIYEQPIHDEVKTSFF